VDAPSPVQVEHRDVQPVRVVPGAHLWRLHGRQGEDGSAELTHVGVGYRRDAGHVLSLHVCRGGRLPTPVEGPRTVGEDEHPAARGVVLGLVLGKPIGIMIATFLLVKLTRATLDPTVSWPDLAAVSVVAGVGFTVSLLIGELSFDAASPHGAHVKAAVLIGSLTSAALGGLLLTWRSQMRARLPATESGERQPDLAGRR